MNIENQPLAIKILIYISPFALVIGGLTYMQLKANRIKKAFYAMTINSVVVSIDDSPQRSIDFFSG